MGNAVARKEQQRREELLENAIIELGRGNFTEVISIYAREDEFYFELAYITAFARFFSTGQADEAIKTIEAIQHHLCTKVWSLREIVPISSLSEFVEVVKATFVELAKKRVDEANLLQFISAFMLELEGVDDHMHQHLLGLCHLRLYTQTNNPAYLNRAVEMACKLRASFRVVSYEALWLGRLRLELDAVVKTDLESSLPKHIHSLAVKDPVSLSTIQQFYVGSQSKIERIVALVEQKLSKMIAQNEPLLLCVSGRRKRGKKYLAQLLAGALKQKGYGSVEVNCSDSKGDDAILSALNENAKCVIVLRAFDTIKVADVARVLQPVASAKDAIVIILYNSAENFALPYSRFLRNLGIKPSLFTLATHHVFDIYPYDDKERRLATAYDLHSWASTYLGGGSASACVVAWSPSTVDHITQSVKQFHAEEVPKMCADVVHSAIRCAVPDAAVDTMKDSIGHDVYVLHYDLLEAKLTAKHISAVVKAEDERRKFLKAFLKERERLNIQTNKDKLDAIDFPKADGAALDTLITRHAQEGQGVEPGQQGFNTSADFAQPDFVVDEQPCLPKPVPSNRLWGALNFLVCCVLCLWFFFNLRVIRESFSKSLSQLLSPISGDGSGFL